MNVSEVMDQLQVGDFYIRLEKYGNEFREVLGYVKYHETTADGAVWVKVGEFSDGYTVTYLDRFWEPNKEITLLSASEATCGARLDTIAQKVSDQFEEAQKRLRQIGDLVKEVVTAQDAYVGNAQVEGAA